MTGEPDRAEPSPPGPAVGGRRACGPPASAVGPRLAAGALVVGGVGAAWWGAPILPWRDIVQQSAPGVAPGIVAPLVGVVITTAAIAAAGVLYRSPTMKPSHFAAAALGACLVAATAYAQTHTQAVRTAVFSLATGPQGASVETYADQTTGQTFDHDAFNTLLVKYVNARGGVDYAGFASESGKLDAYIAALAAADYDALSRDEKLALLINAYNAFTLRLILDYYDGGKLKSIMDIPDDKRWDDVRWQVAGKTVSLNQVEHELIRKNFIEPRIHFAVVCAAYSCPPLRPEAYTADKLDEQLQEQTVYSFNHPRWLVYDGGGAVKLTKLLDWYAGDFTQVAGSPVAYAARFNDELGASVKRGNTPSIEWIDYSWVLNDQATLN